MKIKLLLGALVLLIVVNLAAIGAFLYMQRRAPAPPPMVPAGAPLSPVDEHPDGPGIGGPFPRGPMADLAPEERRRIFQGMRAFQRDVRPLLEETRALEDSLVAAMSARPVRRERVDALLKEIADRRLEIARRATDHAIALGDSLNPEERERLMNAIVRMRAGEGPGGPSPRERLRRWRGGQQR
jgi:uncharacterized membrane protein